MAKMVEEVLSTGKQPKSGRKPVESARTTSGHTQQQHASLRVLTVSISLMDKDAVRVLTSFPGICSYTFEKRLSILSVHLFPGSFSLWDTGFGVLY